MSRRSCCWTSRWARLDLKLRKEMQHELKRIQQEVGHHLHLRHARSGGGADNVGQDRGHERRRDPAGGHAGTTVYNEPQSTAYVASFIGESNIIPGVMLEGLPGACSTIKVFDCAGPRLPGRMSRWMWSSVPRTSTSFPADRGQAPSGEVLKSVLFKGVHYETVVETLAWHLAVTVKMHVVRKHGKPVFGMPRPRRRSPPTTSIWTPPTSRSWMPPTIVARADAQAWNPEHR